MNKKEKKNRFCPSLNNDSTFQGVVLAVDKPVWKYNSISVKHIQKYSFEHSNTISISLNKDGNGVGMRRTTPIPFSSPLYNFFSIPIPNLGQGELSSPMPIYKRANNSIPVPNMFSGIMFLQNMFLQNMGLWNFNKHYLGSHI